MEVKVTNDGGKDDNQRYRMDHFYSAFCLLVTRRETKNVPVRIMDGSSLEGA